MSAGAVAASTLTVAFIAAGVVVAGFGLHLLSLTIGAFFYSHGGARRTPPRTRLTVVVPAHDEARLIARCVRSLRGQTYPSHLYEIVVLADNCTDDTAAIAATAGARVMVRDEPNARGKGRALRWAIDRILGQGSAPEAIVVVDADSVAEPNFLRALVEPFEAGADAVQGESLLSDDGSTGMSLRVVAFLLFNRVRPAGRAAMGRPCILAGNGMLLGRQVLLAKPWEAFTSAEDLEYSLELHLAGYTTAFGGGAVLLSPSAPTPEAADQQQLRWEGGKAHLARSWIPRLIVGALRQRRASLVGVAVDLATPPLGFFTAAAIGGTAIGVGLTVTGPLPVWALAPWVLGLASIPLVVLLGLKAARAPASAYRALVRAPLFVLTNALRLRAVLSFRGDRWVRTERTQATDNGLENLPFG